MTYGRVLLRTSALVLFALGLAGTFIPDVVLELLAAPPSEILVLLVQVVGALYLGFAALNWMARDNAIGGIYSRPVAIGNLMHFLVAGLAAIKLLPGAVRLPGLALFTVVYASFAIAFGVLLFRHPVRGGDAVSTVPEP